MEPLVRRSSLGQRERKYGALAEFALQPDSASMQLNKFLCQRKPQPSAFFLVSIIATHLAKLFKDHRLFSWWDTDTGIAHRDLCTVLGFVGVDADSPSLGSELHCIGQEIDKNLFDLALITDVFPEPIVHVEIQRNAVLDRSLAHKRACVVYCQRQIKRS